ncbi:hypothetical protein QE429_004205 [Bacillus sp. SORGH_AS 510]|uniref:hypothetical protein n=1 Tax=Bacillus sp. SORGH_AS_0510 TaxID=3041771 RepID=UPI00278822FB|nr:hypothetical protein [Bacillus sp. SORGH_AS_0510]MDQ1147378.1 hypothetical protein [Bacillus sp. SORGH_AS_0510]
MNAVLRKIAQGVTVCYSEIFPNNDTDYFPLDYLGKLFLIVDSYCMNPDCTCQEAVLHFLQVYPREEKKAESFMVRYKLNGRGFKIHERGKFNKREIQSIVMHFTADDTILKLLNNRFNEMKEKAQEIILR